MGLRTLEGGITTVSPSCEDLQHAHKSSNVMWLGAFQGPRKENRESWGLSLWSAPVELFWGVLWHPSTITYKITQKSPKIHRWRGQTGGVADMASDETFTTT